MTQTACELCQATNETRIWQDDACRVILVDDPAYPGFCRVIWQAHVAEMTDLTPAEREHFMRVVWRTERALRDVLNPTKINLASLGNVVPHLHWHIIARFADDAHFPRPVWAASLRDGKQRIPPAIEALRAAIDNNEN